MSQGNYRYLIVLPLVVALAVHYGIAAPRFAASSESGAPVAQVTQTQDAPDESVEPAAQAAQSQAASDDASASQVMEQAASEQLTSVITGVGPSREVTDVAQGVVKQKLYGLKMQHKQESQSLAEEFAEQRAARQAAENASTIEGVKVGGSKIKRKLAMKLASQEPDFAKHITYIDQRPILSSGCEIVALTVSLRSLGFKDADANEIADKHLKTGGSAETSYQGSPYSSGGGFAACITDAANSWIKANKADAKAYDLTGTSYKDLCALVKLGYPVLAWTTDGMSSPSVGSSWYYPEHCVVLYGIKGDKVQVCDSLAGLVERDKKRFGEIYETVGKRAVLVAPK